MATYTSGKVQTDTYIYQYIKIIENSQNVADNTTNVTVEVWLNKTTSTATSTSNGKITVNVNGTVVANGASLGSVSISSSADKKIYSWRGNIPHNSDGTKTLSVTAKIDSTYLNGKKASQTYSHALATIARASQPSLSVGSAYLGNSITIYTNRASSSFTHVVDWSFGSASGRISDSVGDSVDWTLPYDLASQIPTSTVGSGLITVYTYSGGTHIGTKQVGFTAYVPDSFLPTFSPSVTDADDRGYLQLKSRFAISINSANGTYGSWITGYQIYIDGVKVSENSSYVSGYLSEAKTYRIDLYVTDSRNRTNYWGGSYTVTAYSNPSISGFTAYRCNGDGNPDDNGAYVRFGGSVSFSSGGNNRTSLKLYISTDGGASYSHMRTILDGSAVYGYDMANETKAEANEDTSFNFYIVAFDYYNSEDGGIKNYASIQATFSLIDFHKDGRGIAFGTSATAGTFEVALPANFNELKEGGRRAVSTNVMSGSSPLACLQNAFGSIPKSIGQAIRLEHGSHSMGFGWFLNGYDYSHAYGGWFISCYGTPVFVGVDNGNWHQEDIITARSIGSHSAGYASSAGNADSVDGLHSANIIARVPWWGYSEAHNADDLYCGMTFAYGNHNAPTTGIIVAFNCQEGTGSNGYPFQLQGGYSSNTLYFRNRQGDGGWWHGWKQVVANGDNYIADVRLIGGSGTATFESRNDRNNVLLHTNNASGLYHNSNTGYGASQWITYINTDGSIVRNTSSDRRLKNDLGNITEEEAKALLEVEPKLFTYKADKSGKVQQGFYAQDLRDVLIENEIGYRGFLNIYENDEEQTEIFDLDHDEDDVTYGIDYSKLVPILWKGWQMHEEKINSLENEVADLKAEIAELKALMKGE